MALAKVKSRVVTGTFTMSIPGGEVSGPVETFSQAPNKTRTLIRLDVSSLGAGQLVVDQRFDGNVGLILDSLQGNRDIAGNQLENLKNGSFPNPFLDDKEKGVAIDLGSREKIDGRDAFLLIVKPRSGSVVREYIDAETYLELRRVMTTDLPQVGALEQTTEFFDYRDVDGVKIPFRVTSVSTAQTSSIVVTKVEHNVAIDETLFSKPAR